MSTGCQKDRQRQQDIRKTEKQADKNRAAKNIHISQLHQNTVSRQFQREDFLCKGFQDSDVFLG